MTLTLTKNRRGHWSLTAANHPQYVSIDLGAGLCGQVWSYGWQVRIRRSDDGMVMRNCGSFKTRSEAEAAARATLSTGAPQ